METEYDISKRYEKNRAAVKAYPNLYSGNLPPFEAVSERILWKDDYCVTYTSLSQTDAPFENKTIFLERFHLLSPYGKVLLFINVIHYSALADLEKASRIENDLPNCLLPFYLYFDEPVFHVFLQLYDLETLLDSSRVVFLVGRTHFETFFSDFDAIAPDFLLGADLERINGLLKKIDEQKQNRLAEAQAEVMRYYGQNADKIRERVKEGRPRLLFITTLFSTAIQYHCQNAYQAALALGLEASFVIEKSPIHRKMYYEIELQAYKPDLVFVVDHLRFEYPLFSLLESLYYICWVQDPMPHIFSKDSPAKLVRRDFICNHYTSWQDFFEIGYPPEKVIKAPIPANETIYRPLLLSEGEQQYACEVCLLCHDCNFDRYVREVSETFAAYKDDIKDLFNEYATIAVEQEEFRWPGKRIADFIAAFLNERGIVFSEEVLSKLNKGLGISAAQKLYRLCLARWLIEAGFDVKLWGKDWLELEEFKDYACGIAENGESLSKILQAAKIVLGNNVHMTGAARAWESMLSGAFYLSNRIKTELDMANLWEIIGEAVASFQSKEDLIPKVHYYLQNEEERLRLAKIGREAALSKMTFKSFIERLIQELADRV